MSVSLRLMSRVRNRASDADVNDRVDAQGLLCLRERLPSRNVQAIGLRRKFSFRGFLVERVVLNPLVYPSSEAAQDHCCGDLTISIVFGEADPSLSWSTPKNGPGRGQGQQKA